MGGEPCKPCAIKHACELCTAKLPCGQHWMTSTASGKRSAWCTIFQHYNSASLAICSAFCRSSICWRTRRAGRASSSTSQTRMCEQSCMAGGPQAGKQYRATSTPFAGGTSLQRLRRCAGLHVLAPPGDVCACSCLKWL